MRDPKLHPDSYLPEFFTSERLAHYRALGERFPLWCGHWPDEVRQLPEWNRWWSETRFRLFLDEWAPFRGKKERTVFFGEDTHGVPLVPTEDMILGPEVSWRAGPDWPGFTQDFDPPMIGAVLAAIAYVHTALAPEPTLDLADQWADEIRRYMNRPHRGGSYAYAFLAQRNRVMLARGRRREAEYAKLEGVWVSLGQRMRILPPKLRGGPAVTLPPGFLQELLLEGQRLVIEVGGWGPGPADFAQISTLLGVGHDGLDEDERALVEEIERRRGPDAAESRRREIIERTGRQAESEKWARRLRFPLLNREELLLLDMRSKSSRTAGNPRTTARKLLEKRLEVRVGYLKDHLRGKE